MVNRPPAGLLSNDRIWLPAQPDRDAATAKVNASRCDRDAGASINRPRAGQALQRLDLVHQLMRIVLDHPHQPADVPQVRAVPDAGVVPVVVMAMTFADAGQGVVEVMDQRIELADITA